MNETTQQPPELPTWLAVGFWLACGFACGFASTYPNRNTPDYVRGHEAGYAAGFADGREQALIDDGITPRIRITH